MVASVMGGSKPVEVQALELRFLQLLLQSNQSDSSRWDEPDPDSDILAFKIAIEREAALARQEKRQQDKLLQSQIEQQLQLGWQSDMANHLAAPEHVLPLTAVTAKQLLLLEILYQPQPDISRLRLVVAEHPWLARDLTNVINSPAFSHRRAQNQDIQVSDLKLVLGHLGMDNLRLLGPYFVCRHWLPQYHGGLQWINRKLWRYSQIQGVAARALAVLHQQDEFQLYSLSLLRQLGLISLLTLATTVFERLRSRWLKEASQDRDKQLYDAVALSQFPMAELVQILQRDALLLNWQLPQLLGFANSPMVQLLQSLAQAPFRHMPAVAQLQSKAACFSQLLLLQEANGLSFRERQLSQVYHELDTQELAHLQRQNYRRLTLF